MSKKVADIIVDTLQKAGVKHCYGIVGDTLNLIARSLERSKIEWVSVRHEEAGAFAAQAEAQLTGQLTAVAGSCGPGSLHFINGLFEANRNRAPVILITKSDNPAMNWASTSFRKSTSSRSTTAAAFFAHMIYTRSKLAARRSLLAETAWRNAVLRFLSCPRTFQPRLCAKTSRTRYMSQIPLSDQATLISRTSQKFSIRAKK
jgi:pyruvate dehydrogenase (quinone)